MNEIRCQKCNRVIGYGSEFITGPILLTCVWCAECKTSAHYIARDEAFDAAIDNCPEDPDVQRRYAEAGWPAQPGGRAR